MSEKKEKILQSSYLTPVEVAEFQKLVFETKGIKLTREEAEDQGTRLINLCEALQKVQVKSRCSNKM